MNHDEYTKNVLKTNPLVRHLFSKLGSQVKAITPNGDFRGILRTIDVSSHRIEIEDRNNMWYVNWRYIVALKTPKTVER